MDSWMATPTLFRWDQEGVSVTTDLKSFLLKSHVLHNWPPELLREYIHDDNSARLFKDLQEFYERAS